MIMNYGFKIQWANITFSSSCGNNRLLLDSLAIATRNAPHNQILVSIHFRLYPDLRLAKDNTESCSLC